MRTEFVVFAALLGCVFGNVRQFGPGDLDIRDLRDLPERRPWPPIDIGQIRPIDPIRPIRPWPPVDWPRKCHAESGGWGYEDLPYSKWPRSTSSNVFYVGCKVWRPTWSSCSGTCESSQNISTTATKPSTKCSCCRSAYTYIVVPYPRCWVIRINNGVFGSGRFETVRQKVNYNYHSVGRCDCRSCLGRSPHVGTLGRGGEELSENDVIGRPAPPTPSDAELRGDLSTAQRFVPGLRGVLEA